MRSNPKIRRKSKNNDHCRKFFYCVMNNCLIKPSYISVQKAIVYLSSFLLWNFFHRKYKQAEKMWQEKTCARKKCVAGKSVGLVKTWSEKKDIRGKNVPEKNMWQKKTCAIKKCQCLRRESLLESVFMPAFAHPWVLKIVWARSLGRKNRWSLVPVPFVPIFADRFSDLIPNFGLVPMSSVCSGEVWLTMKKARPVWIHNNVVKDVWDVTTGLCSLEDKP